MSGNSFSRWAASLVSDVMARLVATWHAVFPPKSPWATSNNAGRKALDAGCYDQAEKQSYAAGTYFDVPAKSGFTIVVGEGICQYVCSFLS